MVLRGEWVVAFLVLQATAWAADHPRFVEPGPGLGSLVTLEQNWTDEESNWFYNVPQGSQLIPYDWFLHLELLDGSGLFRNSGHIQSLGYITRKPDPKNPDGLPVGFIKDVPYEDGTPALGITCAACHTGQINVNGKAILVDGAPALGDFERFLKELAKALEATATDEPRFGRFASKVLPPDSDPSLKKALRASVRQVAGQRLSYNERNLPELPKDRFGPGRVDAFGAIFNEVTTTFLGIPQNQHPANAPVSYPCLWDAPQHDRVQWNGAAENKKSPIGRILFGTNEVGALGRNAGEVLGVFGHASINTTELLIPRHYQSTVNKPNLKDIENSLKKLWSPQWPAQLLGNIDAAKRDRGKILYDNHCAKCHAVIDRKSESRTVAAQLAYVDTDETMNTNFTRKAKTGRLDGRRKTLMGIERFGETDAAGAILKHVVERVILNPLLTPGEFKDALREIAQSGDALSHIDELNPGFRVTATIDVGERRLFGQIDSLVTEGQSVKVGGGRFRLLARDQETRNAEGEVVDLRNDEGLRDALEKLRGIIVAESPDSPPDVGDHEVKLQNPKVKMGYKARPLNGIWATAPYLHNGSVPNLVELLKPAAERAPTFHVGSREYDPVNVGFKDDPAQPLFDTSVPGNSNKGHSFAAPLSKEERRDLLEYLKSL